MKWISLLCLKLFIITSSVQTDSNFTFTYDMAMQCKEHICQHGYNYETFYLVDYADRKAVRSDPSIVFEMHIAILAASNGHILLSTVPKPDATDPVYEIVVGGGANKFTELRGNLKRNARASAKTVGILSTVNFRAFYIKITEDGLIEFGREGEILPIISYQDMNPLTVRYFSFAAWNGVEAKFLFDCPIPLANGSSVTPSSQAVEPKLTNSERLLRTLLLNKDPYQPPRPKFTVNIGVKVTSIMYDAFESKLSTAVSIVRKWTDDSMAWNPSKFNGTTYLTFRQGQIWSPTLSVFNSDSISMLDAKNQELIYMVNSGEATLHMQTSIQTWCFDYDNTITKWPRDEYLCTIVLEPWELHDQIVLRQLDANSDAMKAFTVIDDVVQNGWDVSTHQYVVNSSAWNQIYTFDDNSTRLNDRYIINVSLKRRATSYNIVFYTPLLVLVTFVLLSFWSERLNMKRVWFYGCCTVVICMGLCNIDFLVPSHTVPTIMILYVAVLGGVLLALLVHVALMTSLAKRICKTTFIQNNLTSQWFRALFCLPPLKVCQIYETVDECYTRQDDDDSGGMGSRNGNIEEMQSDNKEYSESMEVAEAIDKLMFFVYSISFAIMLALHF
ncbi:acetylcholine receptor-like protein cup-4 [Vanessa atalanta]|uniref:acetylcholine receptor-like protein cup-4 n=1 Tax=Vanessa atalanta TaxID=42275 RepID=UPI001FCDE994|nr:acetylcholine receptor-like protein cup-4 [Vanessa atalanta]